MASTGAMEVEAGAQKFDPSTSSSSTREIVDAKTLAELEKNANLDADNYDRHAKLVQALRSNVQAESADGKVKPAIFAKLRKARENMSEKFPLPEKTWVEWLDDETQFFLGIRDSGSTEEKAEAFTYLKDLHDRSVDDYLSVELWTRYAELLWRDPSERERKVARKENKAPAEDIMAVYELAVKEIGLHMSQGHQIWQSYRDYYEVAAGDNSKDSMKESVRELFVRELSTPLDGMDQTMSAFINWERATRGKSPGQSFLKIYSKSKAEREKRVDFEEKVTAVYEQLRSQPHFSPGMASTELLSAWQEYIAFEKKQAKGKHSARTKVLYERAIAQCFLSDVIWKEYLDFAQEVMRDDEFTCEVYHRAVRNCPWSSDLWIDFLRALEKLGDQGEWMDAMQKAVGSTSLPTEALVLIQLEYCDFIRRRLGIGETNLRAEKGEIARTASLRAAFDMCQQSLESIPEEKAKQYDLYFTFYSYWADVEMRHYRNIEQSRIQWEALLTKDLQDIRVWRSFIAQERAFGDISSTRALYKRAVSSLATSHYELSDICQDWVKFEREAGDLASLREAVNRTKRRIQQALDYRAKEDEKMYLQQQEQQAQIMQQAKEEAQKQLKRKQEKQKEREKYATGMGKSVESEGKMATSSSTSTKPQSFKKRKRSEDDAGAINAEDAQAGKRQKGEGEEAKDDTAEDSKKWFMDKDKIASRNDAKTAFVLNLAFATTDKQLEELFSPLGKVVQIRHIRDGKGKSKGYAYIEFEDEKSVEAAIQKLHLTNLNDRPIRVMHCKQRNNSLGAPSKGGKRKRGSEDAQQPEIATVFVKFLPRLGGELRTCEERMRKLLTDHFNACGEIKAVRLTLDKKGKLKNFAYIEFVRPDSVKEAIKLSGTHLKDNPGKKPISVMKSCPPSKKKQILKKATKEPAVKRKRGRAMVSLVPRSITRNIGSKRSVNRSDVATIDARDTAASSNAAHEDGESSTGGKAGQKTNADFRAMLLGKKK